jgi:AcrB/AcrD/AcrF family
VLDLPIPSAAEIPVIPQALAARTVPLAELGRFVREPVDPIIYHKDLRPVEYVVGDVVSWPGAPVYAMFAIQDLLKDYTTPDGVKDPSGTWFGPPKDTNKSTFEWTGEWTVTYETFRDMGIAFMVALFFIYMLIVGEFGNFTLPAITIAPIPLTLLGIIPGHWLLNAAFTATSMIGFIALAGIIVRNSILLVDFARIEVERGVDVKRAVVHAVETRTRPIMITALALVLGSSVILTDPIFQGLAVSLLFGVLVSTVLTLIVIPLGCVSARKSFQPPEPEAGRPGEAAPPEAAPEAEGPPSEVERKVAKRSAAAAGFRMLGKLLLGVFVVIGTVLAWLWRYILAPLFRWATGRARATRPASPQPLPAGPPAQAADRAAQPVAATASTGAPQASSSAAGPQSADLAATAEEESPPAAAESSDTSLPREAAPTDREPSLPPMVSGEAALDAGQAESQPSAENEPAAEEGGGSMPARARDRGAPRRRGIRLKSGIAGKDTAGTDR